MTNVCERCGTTDIEDGEILCEDCDIETDKQENLICESEIKKTETYQVYGEKFLEIKIDGNKIIRTSEFKVFPYNFIELIEDLNCYISDDWEFLADKTIYLNRLEEFDTFEVDTVLEWVEELIEQRKGDDDDIGDIAWLDKWVEPLTLAKGFTIHLQWIPDWVKK